MLHVRGCVIDGVLQYMYVGVLLMVCYVNEREQQRLDN